MFDISVVVTCFNQQDLIGQAVGSVLQQSTLGRVREIVVVNDGSTDGSAATIDKLESDHELVRGHHQANGGAAAARNAGIHASAGSHIAFLDGDDLWLPEKLEVQEDYITRFPMRRSCSPTSSSSRMPPTTTV